VAGQVHIMSFMVRFHPQWLKARHGARRQPAILRTVQALFSYSMCSKITCNWVETGAAPCTTLAATHRGRVLAEAEPVWVDLAPGPGPQFSGPTVPPECAVLDLIPALLDFTVLHQSTPY
jgi:hypothetical protein